jgi:hypothetical protein
MDERALRRFVGWASVGFGVGMLLDPPRVARLFGVDGRVGLVRYLALRDLVVGLGALTQPDLRPWVRARALADTTDTLIFGAGLVTGRFRGGRALFSLCAAGGTAAFGWSQVRRLEADRAER